MNGTFSDWRMRAFQSNLKSEQASERKNSSKKKKIESWSWYEDWMYVFGEGDTFRYCKLYFEVQISRLVCWKGAASLRGMAASVWAEKEARFN